MQRFFSCDKQKSLISSTAKIPIFVIKGFNLKSYKCIIFDCDGVLVDSEVLGSQVFVDLANENGAGIDLDYAMQHFKGGHLSDSIRQVEEIIRKSLPENFIADYRKQSYEVFKAELQPIEGIKSVLDSLEIPFCTASSGPMEKITENLKTTGLYSFFDGNIFSCYDIEKWKPDPAIYLLAAKTMGFEIHDCLVIEDSMAGVMAAKNGGFDVYGYDSLEENLLTKYCNKVFNSMDELIPMMNSNDG